MDNFDWYTATENQIDWWHIDNAADMVRRSCADVDRLIANHLPQAVIAEYVRRVIFWRGVHRDALAGVAEE